MSPAASDTATVSAEQAQRNLGLVAHYAGMASDALAVGNVSIAIQAFQSMVLHARLASLDVRAIEGLVATPIAEAAE